MGAERNNNAKSAGRERSEKAVSRLVTILTVGFFTPGVTNLAYWIALLFWPVIVITPYGGVVPDVDTSQAESALPFLALWGLVFGLIHLPPFLALGAVAWWLAKKRPDQMPVNDWMVTGGTIGLIGASVFFWWSEAAPYLWGNESDPTATGLVLLAGIVGLLPGAAAATLGAASGFILYRALQFVGGHTPHPRR